MGFPHWTDILDRNNNFFRDSCIICYFSTGILSSLIFIIISIFSLVIEEGINVNKMSDNLLIALITFCLSDSFLSLFH